MFADGRRILLCKSDAIPSHVISSHLTQTRTPSITLPTTKHPFNPPSQKTLLSTRPRTQQAQQSNRPQPLPAFLTAPKNPHTHPPSPRSSRRAARPTYQPRPLVQDSSKAPQNLLFLRTHQYLFQHGPRWKTSLISLSIVNSSV